jgi:TM2 domain-containing membrane protein YozV
MGEATKSKLAGGLLGIFLGSLGIHNFYLGYTGKGIAQLVLWIVGWFTFGFTMVISGIWGLVEGILILTGSINKDGQGNPLKD